MCVVVLLVSVTGVVLLSFVTCNCAQAKLRDTDGSIIRSIPLAVKVVLVLVYVCSKSGSFFCIRALGSKTFDVYRLLNFYVESVLEFTLMTMGYFFLIFKFWLLLTFVSSIRLRVIIILLNI